MERCDGAPQAQAETASESSLSAGLTNRLRELGQAPHLFEHFLHV
jgi:hypothetical protein